MIIDTSALIAILLDEAGSDELLSAIAEERGAIPAPVRVEFMRVASGLRVQRRADAEDMLSRLARSGCTTLPFTESHASIAVSVEPTYGSGNGNGGGLNLLDLMVYAVAKERREPLLCTGKDFATTDIELHAASRPF